MSDDIFRNRIAAALRDLDVLESDADIETALDAVDVEPLSPAVSQRIMGQVRSLIAASARPAVNGVKVTIVREPSQRPAERAQRWMVAVCLAVMCVAVGLLVVASPPGRSGLDGENAVVTVGTPPVVDRPPGDRQPQPVVEQLHSKIGETISTGAQERRRVTLDDGSILYVNEQTTVTLAATRRVKLTKGEVFVEVVPASLLKASSSDDRFIVETPKRTVTALGTKFIVKAAEKQTNVVVTQGKVQVSGVPEVVTAGQELLEDLTQGVSPELKPAKRSAYVVEWVKDLMLAANSAIVPASEHAGGALVVVDPSGQQMQLSLRKFHVDVHIEDGFARTTIDQTYFNHTWQQLEGTFMFPLPADASLSRLAMYVNGKLMEGGMVERDHGRNVFEQIRHTRRDPALLEWVDGSTFQMRVFPLEARQEKRILLSYTQRLPNDYGKSVYRFPAGHNLEGVREWSTHIVAKGAAEKQWHSPSHLLTSRKVDGDLVLDGSGQHVELSDDLVVELVETDAISGAAKSAAPRVSVFEQDGSRYAMLRYRPELKSTEKRGQRNWIFLVENSADRNDVLTRTQTEVVRTLLENAEHDDTFSVVRAAARSKPFRQRPVPCTATNIQAALKFLEDVKPLGALDLEQALTECQRHVRGREDVWLVHLGAGVPVLGESDPTVLQRRFLKDVRYVGVAVGKRWSKTFMQPAASRTGGYVTQINPDENVAWRAFDLYSTLNAPRLTEIELRGIAKGANGPSAAQFLIWSNTLAQGQELAAITRLPAGVAIPQQVTVNGKLNGKEFSESLDLSSVPKSEERTSHLPRSWARLEIDRLVALGAEEHKQQIIELSKAMYVMSPFTSLLVLETEAMYEQFKVDRGRKDHWAMYAAPEQIPVVTDHGPKQATPLENVQERLKQAQSQLEVTKTNHTRSVEAKRPARDIARLDRLLKSQEAEVRLVEAELKRLKQLDGDVVRNVQRSVLYRRPLWPGHYVQHGYPHWKFQMNQNQPLWLESGGGNVRAPLGWASPQLWFDDGNWNTAWGSVSLNGRRSYWARGDFDAITGGSGGGFGGSVDGRFRGLVPSRNFVTLSDEPQLLQYAFEVPTEFSGAIDARSLIWTGSGGQVAAQPMLYGDDFSTDVYFDWSLRTPISGGTQRLPRLLVEEERFAESLPALGVVVDGIAPMDWSKRMSVRGRPGIVNLNAVTDPQVLAALIDDSAVLWSEGLFSGSQNLGAIELEGLISQAQTGRSMFGVGVNPNPVTFSRQLFGEDRADFRFGNTANFGRRTLYRRYAKGLQTEFDVDLNGIVDIQDGDRLLGLNHSLQGIPTRMVRLTAPNADYVSIGSPDADFDAISLQIVGDAVPLYVVPVDGYAYFSVVQGAPHDLTTHAPGLQTWPSDVMGVIEREAAGKVKVVRGDVDPDARRLIERARSHGWERVQLKRSELKALTAKDSATDRAAATANNQPAGNSADLRTLTVLVDGSGRFAFEREVSEGLKEKVFCDGSTLWHVYPEIGLAAKRPFTRFHHATLQSLVPWFVPSADDLSVGADLKLVAERTVRITAKPKDAVQASDAASQAVRVAVDLVFAEDGRLSEVRLMDLKEQKVIAKQTIARNGLLQVFNRDDKLVVEHQFDREPVAAPDAKPDTRGLVVLALPYRTSEKCPVSIPVNLTTNAPDWGKVSEDDASNLLATYFAEGRWSEMTALIKGRFQDRVDNRIGFYVLMQALNLNASEFRNPTAHFPVDPLAAYLEQSRDAVLSNPSRMLTLPETAGPFLKRLAAQHNVAATWTNHNEIAAKNEGQIADTLKAARVAIAETRSATTAQRLLELMNNALVQHPELLKPATARTLAEFADSFETRFGWWPTLREHQIRWLAASGQIDRALKLWDEHLRGLVISGLQPRIPQELWTAIQNHYGQMAGEHCEAATSVVRDVAKDLLAAKRPVATLQLAMALIPLKELKVADELFVEATRNIDETPDKDDVIAVVTHRSLLLTSIEFCRLAGAVEREWFERGEKFVQLAAKISAFAAQASFWRTASELSAGRQRAVERFTRLEKALEIEFAALPKTVNVEVIRNQYRDHLNQLRNIAQSTRGSERATVLKLARNASERWRSIDPNETEVCQLAGRVMDVLGRSRDAWDYWTTPLSAAPESSTAWQQFAALMQSEARFKDADRAWKTAFEREPTNPELLLGHAAMLRDVGERERANELLRRVVNGKWQPRFDQTRQQAQQQLMK